MGSELEQCVSGEFEKSEENGSGNKIKNSEMETSDVAYRAESETDAEDSEYDNSSGNADVDGAETVETAAVSE